MKSRVPHFSFLSDCGASVSALNLSEVKNCSAVLKTTAACAVVGFTASTNE
jgi:hypothetical protein